jgi:hypothetical protein
MRNAKGTESDNAPSFRTRASAGDPESIPTLLDLKMDPRLRQDDISVDRRSEGA